MGKDGGDEEHLFLGEPQWEHLPGGRVRCVQTGHEMLLSAQSTYSSTKKCRSALFEAALQKRTPPLNFFEQSLTAKDKIVCKLTGVVLNKKEDAVWKHMLGKRFEQKLAEKEAAKGIARKDVEMTENTSERPSFKNDTHFGNNAMNGDKAKRERNGKVLADDEVVDEQPEDAKSDGSDFWVPPAGERWDFDSGCNDRWSAPSHSDKINGHTEAAALEDGSNFDNGDTEMLDGEDDSHDSSSSDENIRTKQMSTAPVPRSQKRRAKRLKAESTTRNGK